MLLMMLMPADAADADAADVGADVRRDHTTPSVVGKHPTTADADAR